MADDQWQVQSTTPTPTATPPPTPPPPDQWQVQSTTPTQQPSLWQQIKTEAAPTIGNIKGMVKGAEKTGAGLIDATGAYLGGETPYSPPVTISPTGPTQQAFNTAATWLRKNTDTSKDPYQKEGDIAESVLEFMALPEAEEGKLAAEIPGIADRFSSAGKLIKTLQGDTKLARVFRVGLDSLKAGTRAGAEQGAQTLVKTGGDVEQAKEAATTGAVIGGGMGGAGAAVRETREGLNALRPGTRNIAGAKFQTLANGELNLAPLTPGTADAATAATDEATGNIGKTAVANSLNRSNAARPKVVTPETNPERLLPGQAGFRMQAAGEPTPTEEGKLLLPARKKQIGTRVVAGKGPGEPYNASSFAYGTDEPLPQISDRGDQPAGSHREPIYQYLTSPKPGEEANVTTDTPTTGGGPMILTSDGQMSSVEQARANLAQHERILNDPAITDEMGVRQHQQLLDAHADLSEQLRRYDNHAASQPNFPMHDVVSAVRNTDSLATAAQQLKDAHAPFWQKADELSGGKWTQLREQEKFLEKKIYGPNPTGNLEDIQQQLADNQQKQMDFFDRYRTQLNPQEWETHRSGYQDGIVLSNLNNLIERHFNGITRGEAAARPGQLQRVFQPSANLNQQLEDFYNKGTNRQVLERTIGGNHMLDLKELGQLFENSDRRDAAKGLLDNIGSAIRRHHYGIGGLAGGGLTYGLTHSIGAGVGVLGGAATAGAVTGTLRYITDRLATDPNFAKSFIYATTNKVAPRIAGPLLASRILQSAKTQNLKQPKPPQQGAP
jgi:hypothetical protein